MLSVGTVVVITSDRENKDPLKKALMTEGFNVVFTSEIASAKELITSEKPSILLHNFDVAEVSQSRQFQLRLSKLRFEWDMPRVIVVPKITSEFLALANDAQITKILSKNTSVLAVASELAMTVSANANLSQFQRDIRNMRMHTDPDRQQDEIDKKIEEAWEHYAHDPEVKIEFANLELRRNHLDSAQKIAHQLTASGQQNVRAMSLLARILMKKGDTENAIRILEQADILSPDNCDRLVEMGNIFYSQGNLGKAKRCFKSVIELEPKREEAAKALGEIHISEGDASAAIELFQGSLSEEESAGVFNNAAVQAVNAGDLEKGLLLYESAYKCLKTDRYKHKVLFNVALAQKKIGNFEQAAMTLRQVLEINPKFEKAKKQLENINKTISKSA